MAFIAFARDALGGRAVDAVASGRLQQVEQVEAQREFRRGIALHGQTGALPERMQGVGLRGRDAVEPVAQCARQHGVHAVLRLAIAVVVSDVFLDHHGSAWHQRGAEALLHAAIARLRHGEHQARRQPVLLCAHQGDAAVMGALRQPGAFGIGKLIRDVQLFAAVHADAGIIALFDGLPSGLDR